jgi:hypothetical protein
MAQLVPDGARCHLAGERAALTKRHAAGDKLGVRFVIPDIRISRSLAQYCPLAPRSGERVPRGRAATARRVRGPGARSQQASHRRIAQSSTHLTSGINPVPSATSAPAPHPRNIRWTRMLRSLSPLREARGLVPVISSRCRGALHNIVPSPRAAGRGCLAVAARPPSG